MTEWWRGAVIYQIYPRSFLDTNGDGIGDLPGITAGLPYVASLGVDAIWLSPFFTSPMKDFGYDVADYCDVDPMFGTLGDFDRLIAEAHRLGLKVIIDQVYSHSSDRHPWFEESRQNRINPKADWYVWADPNPDGTAPNNWLAVFGGIAWEWEPRRQQYYFHNFLKEQPDLNFHNPQVQDAVLEAIRFWLDRGVDGFRIDVANLYCHDRQLRNNPPSNHPAPLKPARMQRATYNRSQPETFDFVCRWRALLDQYPGTMSVAEIASDDQTDTMIAYTDGQDRYHTAYSFALLRVPITAAGVRRTLEEMLEHSATAWPSWSFSNHDVCRVVSRQPAEHQGPGLAKVLIALLCCLRGTIFLYQGEELGLPEAEVPFDKLKDPEGLAFWPRFRGRDGARTPMPWTVDGKQAGFSITEPWLPLDPRHLDLTVDHQDEDPESVLTFTRRFLAWRQRHPVLKLGNIRFLNVPEPVVAFVRSDEHEVIVIVVNLGSQPITVGLAVGGEMTVLEGHGLKGDLSGRWAYLPGHGGVVARVW